MSDFDFDELDKAVSGVLGTSPTKRDEGSKVPDVLASPTDSAASASTVVSTASVAPAAKRTAGRFMDVVHPSSDMRARATAQATTTPSSSSSSSEPLGVGASATDTAHENDEATPAWSQPLESPFLPDAKVEKRPLGGDPLMSSVFEVENTLAEPLPPQEAVPKLEAPDDSRIEAHTMPDPIDFAAQTVPAETELEPEHVASDSEAIEDDAQADNSTVADDAELKLQPVDTGIDAQTVSEDASESSSPALVQDDVTPTGPLSITQQYTEQPRTEQVSGAIYDTEAYHQPVAHPVKKKSGIGVIIWILVLLVVGAGAGVAFYFYVLPLL